MSDSPKPPYVQFETRAIEDRTASEASGHYVAKDVDFAIVTPAGSKDRLEKIVEDWFASLAEGVQQERIPATWLGAYKEAYKAWKESREIPEDGTPVATWPSASPAQIKMLLDLNLRTVEHVAEATEEAITHMGMGGRALKSKAIAWLDASKGQGKLANELDNLRKQVEDLTSREVAREEELKTLKKRNEELEKAKA